jgi:bacterioferritin (cytochrome b1)
MKKQIPSNTQNLLKIDLEEIVRQQADHILDLEFQLQEITGKWKYLEQEMMDYAVQKEMEHNFG